MIKVSETKHFMLAQIEADRLQVTNKDRELWIMEKEREKN